jgi:quinol-cytochrome oxidoreductase complex cytochrome b subunit
MATADLPPVPSMRPVSKGVLPVGAVRRRFRTAGDWADDRLGLSALRYRVPAHANTIWYTLGGITFVGILILVATGIWLTQYYDPNPAGAHESVIYIQNQVTFGDVIRGIHVWTAYIVVITAALHLIRVVVTASYKIPREINWLVGLGLLALLLFGAVFTGTVLRWDQESYEALSHNMEIAKVLGGFGGFLSDTFTQSTSLLSRLYVTHVAIVPLLLVLLLVLHFFLIKHHGISPTPSEADNGEAPDGRLPEAKLTGRYTTHLRIMTGYGLAVLGLAGTLGVILVQRVGPTPDPTIEVTKPPFLFYWLYAFEDWFQVKGIIYAAAGFFGLLALLPFLDRTPLRTIRRRPVIAALGVALLIAIATLSILTAVRPVANHMGG